MDYSEFYDNLYDGIPRWDIDYVQPEIAQLVNSNLLQGNVLDIGCGTGENAIYISKKGITVTGMDISLKAITKAQNKAKLKDANATFLVDDALNLKGNYKLFDTVIDSCLYHCIHEKEANQYITSLEKLLVTGGNLYILCFSEFEPLEWGPRRIKEYELIQFFQKNWKINFIRKAEIECRVYIRIKDDKGRESNPPTKKVIGWLAHITKL